MKKILITITIFLFTATVTGYAQLFMDNDITDNTGTTDGSSYSGGEYSNGGDYSYTGSEYSSGDSDEDAGFFRTPPEDDNKPGGRPDSGGGIGQEAPLDDGLSILIVCCVILVIVKVLKNKWNKRRKPTNSSPNWDYDQHSESIQAFLLSKIRHKK